MSKKNSTVFCVVLFLYNIAFASGDLFEQERLGRGFLDALEREDRQFVAQRFRVASDLFVVESARNGDIRILQMLYERGDNLLRDYNARSLLCHVVDADYEDKNREKSLERQCAAQFLLRIGTSPQQVRYVSAKPCSDQMADLLVKEGGIVEDGLYFLRLYSLPMRRALVASGRLSAAQRRELLLLEVGRFPAEYDLSELLEELNISADCTDEQQNTPLHLMAKHRAHYEDAVSSAEALLRAGAPLEARDGAGRTALIFAARSGNSELVNFLLNRGADPTIQDKTGRTALHWAAACGNESTVWRLLMTKRFSARQIAGHKDSAETAARLVRQKRIAEILRRYVESLSQPFASQSITGSDQRYLHPALYPSLIIQ